MGFRGENQVGRNALLPVEILNEKEKESAAKYVRIEQVREHSKERQGSVVGSDGKTSQSFYSCLTRVTAWVLRKGGKKREFMGALRQTATRQASQRCRNGPAVRSLKRGKLAGEQRFTRNASC